MLIKAMQVFTMLIFLILLIPKDTKSAIKNKLIDLLNKIRVCKFVTTLAILTRKQTQLLIRVIKMMYLNQSILQLYQTYKNILQKARVQL